MSARALALPLALLALAGCVQQDPALAPAATTAPTAAPELEEAPQESPSAPGAAPSAPRTVPVAYEGRTGRWACVPDSPQSCKGLDLGADGENALYVLPLAGIRAIEGALTWTAATPATADLRIVVGVSTPCGESCITWTTTAAFEGPSPLTVERTALTLPPDGTALLLVEVPDLVDAPFPYAVSLDQPFAFDGAATVG